MQVVILHRHNSNNDTTPKITPEMTQDTQRPQALLRGVSGGEMEEKEKQKDVGTMKRGRTGDLRVERNNLMCVACFAT